MDDLFEKRPGGSGGFFIKRTPRVDQETIDHGISYACPSGDLTLRLPLAAITQRLAPYEIVLTDRLHGGLTP
jgi:exopolysaccharide biosynthesis predicted pyruvyltransferase EpsI